MSINQMVSTMKAFSGPVENIHNWPVSGLCDGWGDDALIRNCPMEARLLRDCRTVPPPLFPRRSPECRGTACKNWTCWRIGFALLRTTRDGGAVWRGQPVGRLGDSWDTSPLRKTRRSTAGACGRHGSANAPP